MKPNPHPSIRKKVPLFTWAALRYDPVPPMATLRRWARQGRFSPPAEKAGKGYVVREDAVLIGAVSHTNTTFAQEVA